MLAAIGDAKTCPHGHPIDVGQRIEAVPLADVEIGASVRIVRFENEAEDLLHYLMATGIEPGMEGTRFERIAARPQGTASHAISPSYLPRASMPCTASLPREPDHAP